MRIPYKLRNEETYLNALKEFAKNIDDTIQQKSDESLISIRNKFNEILVNHNLLYVDLNGGRTEFVDAVNSFLPEIIYALDQEIVRLDPGWKHFLMSKKMSDMTGYEYKTYLELIG